MSTVNRLSHLTFQDGLRGPDVDDEPARQASLRRQSDDYARHGEKAATEHDAQALYQAGYFALIAGLPAKEVSAVQDHPSATAARMSAKLIGLAAADQTLAELGAASYFTARLTQVKPCEVWAGWATRVRRAAGWEA